MLPGGDDWLVLKMALSRLVDDFMLLDSKMTIVWCNHAAQGQNIGDAFVSDFGAEDCLARRCLASGREETRTLLLDDGRCLEIRAMPIREDGEVVSHVFYKRRDITEKSIYEQDSARIARLAALGELSAGVAHEINNPIGMALVNLRLLRDLFRDLLPLAEAHHAVDPTARYGGLGFDHFHDKVPQLIEAAISGAERVRRIVSDLKEFVRSKPDHELKRCDINALVRTAVRLTESTLHKQTREFLQEMADELPQVFGNSQLLEQVIVNLLINAGQAVQQQRGSVRIATGFDGDRSRVWVKVQDDGVGIAPEHLGRVTDPFFTTRRNEGGTGLGLSLAAKIAEVHEGSLRIVSKPGGGTTVTFELPAAVGEKGEGDV